MAAIENRKIREYGNLEKEHNTGAVVNYLLALLGISTTKGDGKNLHYLAVDDYINTGLDRYSYEEIKEAFKMLIDGVFADEIQVFNKLDCILVGKVMRLYDKEKIRITADYYNRLNKNIYLLEQEKNEPSKEEKDELVRNGIIACFEHFKEFKEIPAGRIYVFDSLFERKILKPSNTYYAVKLQEAHKIIKDKALENKKDPESQKILTNIEKGSYTGELRLARELVLIDYFNKIIGEGKSISEII